jgi:hypothetical protein
VAVWLLKPFLLTFTSICIFSGSLLYLSKGVIIVSAFLFIALLEFLIIFGIFTEKVKKISVEDEEKNKKAFQAKGNDFNEPPSNIKQSKNPNLEKDPTKSFEIQNPQFSNNNPNLTNETFIEKKESKSPNTKIKKNNSNKNNSNKPPNSISKVPLKKISTIKSPNPNFIIEWKKDEKKTYEKAFKNTISAGIYQDTIEKFSSNSLYCLTWLLSEKQGQNFLESVLNSTFKFLFILNFRKGLIKSLKYKKYKKSKKSKKEPKNKKEIKNPMNYLEDFAKKVNKKPNVLKPYFEKMQQVKIKNKDKLFTKKDFEKFLKICLPSLKTI